MKFSIITLFLFVVGYVVGLPTSGMNGKIDHFKTNYSPRNVLKDTTQKRARAVDSKVKPYTPKYDQQIGLKSVPPPWRRSFDRVKRVFSGPKFSGGNSKGSICPSSNDIGC